MVRNYKENGTRSGEINEMSSAIRDVLDNKLSIRKSAEKYAVKPSTLESRITKIREEASVERTKLSNRTFRSKYASHQVFSNEEESLLNNYMIDCSKMHYGLTCIQVRKLAYGYAKANSPKYPSNWDENMMAGKDWLQCFRNRDKPEFA
ncbi:hypothetical protein JTB14_010302 [Gonioctena quinquepunctata]|nr:hypothetical protein JTB14_010302 [Gonioctena quinquepunctata]